METFRRTCAEINLDHLAHNVREIQKAFPQVPFLCPMVKADAYGHGDVQVTQVLEKLGIKHVGVCLIEEALRLRNAGIKTDILVFGGFDQDGAKTLLENNLTPVVATWGQVAALEACHNKIISIHLKFDTGMNRLGFRPEEANELFNYFSTSKKIKLEALLTHLYNGEDAREDNEQSATQLKTFYSIVQMFKPLGVFSHVLNSSGILNKQTMQMDGLVSEKHPLFLENWGLRPGLMIYGYDTLVENRAIVLKPVMSLKAQVNMLRKVLKDEVVSYGGKWKAERDSVVAVISLGYADGYHRILSNQASVLFAGQRARVVGTICMDYLMLDVTDIVQNLDFKEFQDAEVIFFGKSENDAEISATELAQLAQTNSYEILTSVSARVPRVYKGTEHESH